MKTLSFALISILIFPSNSSAAFFDKVDSPGLLNINAGEVEVLDSTTNIRYGLEYRHRAISKWHLVPSAGYVFTEDDASFLYFELKRDFRIAPKWLFTSSFGPGLFDEGNGLDLGHTLEFRSGIELAYQHDLDYRFAMSFFHLSNGSISDDNPGTEALVLSIMVPLDE